MLSYYTFTSWHNVSCIVIILIQSFESDCLKEPIPVNESALPALMQSDPVLRQFYDVSSSICKILYPAKRISEQWK